MTITLSPQEEQKLAERAAEAGQDKLEYVHRLIRKDIETPTLAERFAPVHEAVRASGIKQDELDSLLHSAIEGSRTERKPGR